MCSHQFTTDSTCLSPRSQKLEAQNFSLEERQKLLSLYYDQLVSTNTVVGKKTDAEIKAIMKKYADAFPKLVSKLEKKYSIQFETSTNNQKSTAEKNINESEL